MKPYEIKNVLVPMDFSKIALNALDTAVGICKRQKANLSLIHVVENTYVLLPPEAGTASSIVLYEMMRKAKDSLEALVKDLHCNHDITGDYVVRFGNPADEICQWAFHKEFDLIIMGNHGVSGLREFFIGSNAYRVVKNASCPVMTIPGTNRWISLRKVLFPVRIIPHALEKYDIVRPIIQGNGSSILIAGIVKKTDPVGLMEMKALVDYVKIKMEEDNIICGSEVHYTENVARHVLEISENEKPDIIVITATLDESMHDFFLGPYTQDIVNHSHFPVLSIRPELTRNYVGVLINPVLQAFDGLYQQSDN